ncbi:MAG: PAS domain S-box protein [Planctomycetes bacterium]|nr:PAS domain S-box protein [Planctomycetota bacterium]MBI3845154.1 PAS domain S-box protein [Planctomycetota bacterium]
MLHPLLQRQLKKVGIGDVSAVPSAEVLAQLLERVSRSYTESDQDRYTLERSLRVSSAEMQELNSRLTAESNHLAIVMRSIGDGLYVLDPEGRLVFMNAEADRLLRWRESDLRERPVWEIIVPDDLREADGSHRTLGLREAVARGQGNREWDCEIRRADGSTIPVAYVLNPVVSGGAVLGWVLVFRDITDRKQAEEKLRQSEEKFRLIVDSAHDAVVMMNAAGEVSGWNVEAERTFGWSRAEAVGRRLSDLIVPQRYRESHERGLSSFLETGEGSVVNRRIEVTARDRNGREFPAEVTVCPVKTGGSFEFSGFVRDISERKKAMSDLEAAKNAAEAANRAKSEFLANMSHELRTPMNGILGFVSLLSDTGLDSEQRECVDVVQASARSLLTVLNDILDFSKIEAGKLEIEAIEFDVRRLVEAIGDLLAPRAVEKRLELICAVDPSTPSVVRGDPTRIRQVLLNLLGNALKFTDRGEVSLIAWADEGDAADIRVHFRVRDTGIGIPGNKRDRLFKAFSQVDGSTTRHYGGTGLGLVITRRLVELMGGQIEFESELGVGSTFTVTVPFARADAGHRSAIVPSPALAGIRLLVVDDNESQRLHLVETLRWFGCEPDAASGGAEALVLLHRAVEAGRPFAVALIDSQMPEMDGVGLADAIRLDSTIAKTPLVLLSLLEPTRSVAAKERGFAATLTKPVKSDALRGALLAVTSAQHEEVAESRTAPRPESAGPAMA